MNEAVELVQIVDHVGGVHRLQPHTQNDRDEQENFVLFFRG